MIKRIIQLSILLTVCLLVKNLPIFEKFKRSYLKDYDPNYCVKYENYSSEAVSYFNEIALKTESGLTLRYLSKYTEDVFIYVEGHQPKYIQEELQKIVFDLNMIIDPIEVRITENKSESNLIVTIGSLKEIRKRYQIFLSHRFDNSRGGFSIGNENFSHCFLNTKNIESVESAKHVLREEITQSLGLPNDSWKYAESIFYQGGSTSMKYSELDKQLISMLYN